MAQTIRLWPRAMSPQTKTPSTLVCQSAAAATFARVQLEPRARPPRPAAPVPRSPWPAAPGRPGAQRVPGDRLEAAVDRAHLESWRAAPPPRPVRRRRTPWWSPRRAARRLLRGPSEVRRISGQVGQGLSAAGSAGGSGMISSWCTDAAPWRCAVPRQSAPVSPPPMMTTCLPLASIGDRAERALAAPGWTASGTPWPGGSRRARARDGQVARHGRPAGQHHGVEACTSAPDAPCVGGARLPCRRSRPRDLGRPSTRAHRRGAARTVTPSARIWARRRSRTAFSILNSGMP